MTSVMPRDGICYGLALYKLNQTDNNLLLMAPQSPLPLRLGVLLSSLIK